jgi:hypothetical protein
MDNMTATDWAPVSVAAATVLLAVATFVMARRTTRAAVASEQVARETQILAEEAVNQVEAVREQSLATLRQAKSSERQIELSQKALEASMQPWLTRVTPPPYAEFGKVSLTAEQAIAINEVQGTINISFYLRNVGVGLAIIQSQEHLRERFVVEGRDVDGQTVRRFGFASAAAVAPGETTRVAFKVEHVNMDHFFGSDRNDGEFYVSVPYTDGRGGQLVDARLHVTRIKAHGEWSIHRIEYSNDVEDSPFAVVEFDAGTWR